MLFPNDKSAVNNSYYYNFYSIWKQKRIYYLSWLLTQVFRGKLSNLAGKNKRIKIETANSLIISTFHPQTSRNLKTLSIGFFTIQTPK